MLRRRRGEDRGGDAFAQLPHRIVGQVGVACGRRRLGLAQRFADDIEASAIGRGKGDKGVAQVMQSHFDEPGFTADASARMHRAPAREKEHRTSAQGAHARAGKP